MKRDYNLLIKDILSAIKAINDFIGGMDFEEFKEDDKTSSAVIRKFEIIGEAAKYIPESIKEKNSNISWKEIAGMRDRLIHGYFGIDFVLVWETIKIDLPDLEVKLQKLIKNRE